MMRITIGVVFAAAFTISGAAQDFIAQSGVPTVAFPKPDRPVADIVSPKEIRKLEPHEHK
jgi:hypothetical protein